MVVDYSQGKIYKIEPTCPHDEGDIYIGSTSTPRLCNRLSQHKNEYQRYNNKIISKRTRSFDLFDKYSVENCQIFLIENVNAKTKDELRAREHYHITNAKCVNFSIPFVVGKPYENQKEWKQIWNKDYKEKNKETLKEKNKEYRDNHKEQAHEYYINNKERIAEYSKTQHQCQCGGHYTTLHKQRHLRTTKHIQFQEKNAGI